MILNIFPCPNCGRRGCDRKQEKCDKCSKMYCTGEWPFCPHGIPTSLAPFKEYWDEHVAPEPSHKFRRPAGIEYHPDRGYRITNAGDRQRLMRANHSEYRRKKRGMPGQEF